MEPGIYRITSKRDDRYIGRDIVEDRSLFPKRVIALAQVYGSDPPEWVFEKSKDGGFIMTTRCTPTVNLDEKLFAILLKDPAPTVWQIRSCGESESDNVYVIACNGNPNFVWTVPDTEDNDQPQIAILPFEGPEQVNQLFVIRPIDSN